MNYNKNIKLVIVILVFICLSVPSQSYGQLLYRQVEVLYADEGIFLPISVISNINHLGQVNSPNDLNDLGLFHLYWAIREKSGSNIQENLAVIYFDLDNRKTGFIQPNNFEGIYKKIELNDDIFERTVVAALNTLNALNDHSKATNNALNILKRTNNIDIDVIEYALFRVAITGQTPYISSNILFESYLDIKTEAEILAEKLPEGAIKAKLKEFNDTLNVQLRLHIDDDISLFYSNQDFLFKNFSRDQLNEFERINSQLNQLYLR